MDPRPVVTIHGNDTVFRNFVEQLLKKRLKAKCPTETGRDGFSAQFEFSFKLFERFMTPPSTKRPFYSEPCLHTYWMDAADADNYTARERPNMEVWARYIEKAQAQSTAQKDVEHFVIFCIIQKEKKSVKSVIEKLKTRFGSSFLQLKLSQPDSASREGDPRSVLADRLYHSAHKGFTSLLAMEMNSLPQQQSFDAAFCTNVNLAIGYEVINQPEGALGRYKKLSSDLSEQLRAFAHSGAQCPAWCVRLVEQPCLSWYCPRLTPGADNMSWELLPMVQTWSCSFLDLKLFLYTRLASMAFVLSRAWQCEDTCTSVLHSTARELKWFNVNCPPCAFECWSYSMARVTVLEIMMHLTADVIGNAFLSNSPLLIRVRLWKYAFDKLQAIGEKCCLMAKDETPNDQMVKELVTGLDGQPKSVEEEIGLLKALNSKNGFSEVFVDMGMRVIAVTKFARRRRMAFHVAKTVGTFQCDEEKYEQAEELLLDICKYCPYEGWEILCGPVYQILAKCQKKLKKMVEYVKTVVKILSISASCQEEAEHWMEELKQTSLLSHEELDSRKYLKWSPLFALSASPFTNTGEYFANSTIETSLQVTNCGPKPFTADSVCLVLTSKHEKGASRGVVVMTSSLPKQSPVPYSTSFPSGLYIRTAGLGKSPQQSRRPGLAKEFESMESLDLLAEEPLPLDKGTPPGMSPEDEDSENYVLESSLPHANPTSSLNRSMSFSSILTLDEDDCGGSLCLVANQVALSPGENTVKLSGVAPSPGSFVATRAVLTCGNISFATAAPESASWTRPLVVGGANSNITLTIEPSAPVFLFGARQSCTLRVKVEEGSSIPADARLVLTSKQGLYFFSTNSATSPPVDPKTNFRVFLPAIGSGDTYDLPVDVHIVEQDRGTGNGHPGEDHLPNHQIFEVVAAFTWLYPMQSTLLLIPAYRSIAYSVLEKFTASCCFLQLKIENVCPLPLLLHSPALVCDVDVTSVHEDPPLGLVPKQTFSFLWQVQLSDKPAPVQAEFSVNWIAVSRTEEQRDVTLTDFAESRFDFLINAPQAELIVCPSCAASHGDTIRVNQLVELNFEIKSKLGEMEVLVFGLTANQEDWCVQSEPDGKVEIQRNMEILCFKVRPLRQGQLPYPLLNLWQPLKNGSYKSKLVYNLKKTAYVYVYGDY